MSLQQIRMEHIRGAILGLLDESGGTWINDAVLHEAINAVKGVSASRDQVRTALLWLEEQGVLQREELAPGIVRARINDRGRDFEAGHVHVAGIRRRSQL